MTAEGRLFSGEYDFYVHIFCKLYTNAHTARVRKEPQLGHEAMVGSWLHLTVDC